MISETYNMDCMDYMKGLPDNAFDLAIVDPPYGGGSEGSIKRTGGKWASKFGNKIESWDLVPSSAYFRELFRVSKNQIIWGGNYFSLPPSKSFIIWDKVNISENFTMAMCEYAWSSFNVNAKIIRLLPQQYTARIHPTQKPVALYKWLLANYAKPGDRILDTHLGSGSSRIAAYDMGFDFVGIELDPDYFKAEEERFRNHCAQGDLFREEIEDPEIQEDLFQEDDK